MRNSFLSRRVFIKAILLTGFLASHCVLAQDYPGLISLPGQNQVVYYSQGSEVKASRMARQLKNVNAFYAKHLGSTPEVALLVLSVNDWKNYAADVVYGMPHYRNDQTLVVASEDNGFWKSFIPPMDKIPVDLASRIRNAYSKNGKISMEPFFDLLAIHELGHAYHFQDSIRMQRNWLSELFVNIFLHSYIAENEPGLLPALTTFPEMVVALTDPATLAFTSLHDLHTRYNEIAQKHPQNYGWYQCRWHMAAGTIYDAGKIEMVKRLWVALRTQKKVLDDDRLAEFLKMNVHERLAEVQTNWDNPNKRE